MIWSAGWVREPMRSQLGYVCEWEVIISSMCVFLSWLARVAAGAFAKVQRSASAVLGTARHGPGAQEA